MGLLTPFVVWRPVVAVLVALCVLAASLSLGGPNAAAQAPAPEIFDTAWYLPHRATPEEVDEYFAHLAAVGYTGVFSTVAPLHGTKLAKKNFAGQAMESFEDPNPNWFVYLRWILDRAEAYGLTMTLAPAWGNTYTGAASAFEGFATPPLHEGNAYEFGQLLAAELGDHPALQHWLFGGDYYAAGDEHDNVGVWAALADGLRDGGSDQPIAYHAHRTAHLNGDFSIFDEPWVDIAAPLTGHCRDAEASRKILTRIRDDVGKPVIAGEMRYEGWFVEFCQAGPWLVTPEMVVADTQVVLDEGLAGLAYGHNDRWKWNFKALESLGSPGELAIVEMIPLVGQTVDPPSGPPVYGDTPACGRILATIVGTEGDDVLTGTNGDDVIVAFGGNDRVNGLDGDDIICAGRGDDRVYGGKGDNVVFGGEGRDKIRTANGADSVDGGPGNDIMRTGPGFDRLLGGDGHDWMVASLGDDTLRGGDGNDVMLAGPGDDLLWGGGGDDFLRGKDGIDSCDGGIGVDYIGDDCEDIIDGP